MNAPVLSPSRMPPQDISGLSSSLHGHVGLDVFSPVDQNGSFCFDRVIRTGKVSRRVKKKGAWKASWKPAYLVLRPNLLSIYGNADETDLRESIALSDITAVARVRKSHLDNVFGVFSPSKNYHFLTPSDKETLDWVTQIRLEARTDDMETYEPPLEPPAPQFSRNTANDSSQSHGYDTTDLSADDSPEPAGSPENNRAIHSQRPRTHSNIEPYYSGPDLYNTSHSDFSDFAPGTSLPKNLPGSNPLNRPLSPIPSSNALRPSITNQCNPSQLSMHAETSTLPPAASTSFPTTQQPTTTAGDTHRDPLRPIRQGYLTILPSSSSRGPSLKLNRTKRLFAVLRPRALSFYKDETEYSVLKMLPVSTIIDAVEIDPQSRTRVYCFEVIAEEKTVRCCVGSEGELEGWLGALKSVIAGSRRERERERGERREQRENKDKERDVATPAPVPNASAGIGAVGSGGGGGSVAPPPPVPVKDVTEGMRRVSVR